MASETYANDYETSLNGSVTAARPVALTFRDAIPSTLSGGNFRVRVDGEYLLVPAGGVSGLICTGCTTVEGSTAAPHADRAVVDQVLTRQGMLNSPGPLTTQGDIAYLDSTLNPARLPLGSNTQVLTADSATGIPKWAAAAAGGASTPLLNPYAASMYRLAAYNTVATTFTKLPFDTVEYDPSGLLTIGSSRLTATVAGKYVVAARASIPNAGRLILSIYVNGAEKKRGPDNAGPNPDGIQLVGVVNLAVGDYVEIFYYSQNVAALDVDAGISAHCEIVLVPGTPAMPANTMTARMYRNAAYNSVAATWTKIPFDTVDFDPSSMCTIGSSRFVAAVAGKYLVTGGWRDTTANSTNFAIGVYVNGAQRNLGPLFGYAAAFGGASMAGIVNLAVGDYVELFYFVQNVIAFDVGSVNTWAEIVFLAGTGATIWVPQGPVVIPGFAGSPDIKAGGANDDEFEQNTSGVPSGWTGFNTPTTIDTNVAKSLLHMLNASNGSTNTHRGVLKAAPAIPYTVTCKLSAWACGGVSFPDFGQVSLMIMDGNTTSKFVEMAIGTNTGGAHHWEVSGSEYSDWATFAASVGTAYQPPQIAPVYLRIVVHSATNIDLYISYDGLTWSLLVSAVNYLVNATYVGLGLRPYSQTTEAYFDWIRFS